jgi:hypothetical protein
VSRTALLTRTMAARLPLLLISEASKQPLELVEVELLSVKEPAVELLKL